jgi:hypothetical protein
MPGAIPVPGRPGFFMLPDGKDAPAATAPLYEFTRGAERRYAIAQTDEGFARAEKPVGRVWPAGGW